MSEVLVLDPIEIAGTGRVEFDITEYVGEAGPDFGDAAVQQVLAEAGRVGQRSIDITYPNRVITVPITVQDRAGLTFEQVRAALQQKCGLFQGRGGFVKRETSIGNLYAEIVGASLKLGGSTMQAIQDVDVDATLTLNVLPDWFGDQLVYTGTASSYESFLMNGVQGDFPARCRIRLTDTSGFILQRGLIWGIRSHNYSPNPQAAVIYSSTDPGVTFGETNLLPVSPATYDSGRILLPSIPQTTDPYNPAWSPVCATHQPSLHVGSYRVWARVRGGSSISVRFTWDANAALDVGTSNAASPIPADTGWLVDLGQITLESPPIGIPYWSGQVEVMSTDSAQSFSLSELMFVPVDDGYGVLSSSGSDDAVLFPSAPLVSSVEIRTDGVYRASYLKSPTVSKIFGDLPRLPVSGMENETVELFIIVTDSDFVSLPDGGNGLPFDIQVIYYPSYLFAPEFVTVGSGTSGTAPTMSGLSPSSLPYASGASITISGTGFTNVESVLFGGSPAASFIINSSTQITAFPPDALVVGPYPVTVTTLDGTAGPEILTIHYTGP